MATKDVSPAVQRAALETRGLVTPWAQTAWGRMLRHLLILLVALGVFITFLFPFLWLVSTSFKGLLEVFQVPPTWIPQHFTLENYQYLARGGRGENWPLLTWNSIQVAGSAVIIVVALASLAGYGLARIRFPGSGLILWLFLVVQMFPGPSLLVPIYLIITKLGLLNTLTGLIIINSVFALPLATWMSVGNFRAIPVELEEAALVDGASRLIAFIRVVLPLAKAGLITAGIFTFLMAWSEYPFALILIQRPERMVVSVGLGRFLANPDVYWNAMAAGTMVMALPMLLAMIFVQHILVRSIHHTTGALKG